MDVILEGLLEALKLIVSLDDEVLNICMRTMQVSGLSTLISVLIGVPIGAFIALKQFFGRGLIVSIINFGMGLPPVVVGFVTWIVLTRYGPLGMLNLIYTERHK